jgi:hypothetical protein
MGKGDWYLCAVEASRDVDLTRVKAWGRTVVFVDASLLSHSLMVPQNVSACVDYLESGDSTRLTTAFLKIVKNIGSWAPTIVLLFEGVVGVDGIEEGSGAVSHDKQKRRAAAQKASALIKAATRDRTLRAAAAADEAVAKAVLTSAHCADLKAQLVAATLGARSRNELDVIPMVSPPGTENDHLGALLCALFIGAGWSAAVLFRDGDLLHYGVPMLLPDNKVRPCPLGLTWLLSTASATRVRPALLT